MIKVQYLLLEKVDVDIRFNFNDVKETIFNDVDDYFKALKFAYDSDLIFLPLTINYI